MDTIQLITHSHFVLCLLQLMDCQCHLLLPLWPWKSRAGPIGAPSISWRLLGTCLESPAPQMPQSHQAQKYWCLNNLGICSHDFATETQWWGHSLKIGEMIITWVSGEGKEDDFVLGLHPRAVRKSWRKCRCARVMSKGEAVLAGAFPSRHANPSASLLVMPLLPGPHLSQGPFSLASSQPTWPSQDWPLTLAFGVASLWH